MPSGRYLACRATPARLAAVAASGIRHVEVALPAPDQAGPLTAAVAAHGLAISSVQVPLHVEREPDFAEVERRFRMVTDLGVGIVFSSAHTEDDELAAAYARLRRIGDIAASYGLVVALETHPNLITNGDVARQTMEAVAHSSVRVNYDTANVYYYNHGVDSVAELRKVLPYVAALHLKESKGAYESFDFPPLGQGIVDFPAIFRLLDEVGFGGPTTLEIEFENHPDPEGEFVRTLQASVAYLKRIGAA